MKRWISLLLALALLLGCAAAVADEEWPEYHCRQESFSTKIPRAGTTAFETEMGLYGLRIYTGVPGYPPYVIINRRDAERKFKNPKNYLNNVYREFLEEKYGDDTRTTLARAWEVGGKQLIGARYMYVAGGVALTHLQLIEVRDLGDVEYTAVFSEQDEARVMEVLNVAVQNYREDEAAAEEPAESAKFAGKLLEPLDDAGEPVDVENGTFWTKLWGTEYLEEGGFFYADLYTEDLYPRDQVESLQAGDQVRVEGAVMTVASVTPSASREYMYAVVFEEDAAGDYSFLKVDDKYPEKDYYHLLRGSTSVMHFCTDYQVMMPLPYAFQFAWAEGTNVRLWTSDDFVHLLLAGDLKEENMTQDRTAIQFRDGLVTAIVYAE